MRGAGKGAARGSVVTGLASVATLPVAIFLTRFSESYELLHAGLAIPIGIGLGVASLALARRAKQRSAVRLGRDGRLGAHRMGRALGIVGLCLAAAAIVALGVYGLLEYVGSRD